MIAGVSPGESTSPSRTGVVRALVADARRGSPGRGSLRVRCASPFMAPLAPTARPRAWATPGLPVGAVPSKNTFSKASGGRRRCLLALKGWGKQSPMRHYGGTGGKPEARVLVVQVLRSCARLDARERHKKPPAEAGGLRVVCLPGCHVMRVRTGGSRAVVRHGRRGGFHARSPRAPARGFLDGSRAKGARNPRRKAGDTAVRDRRSVGHAFPHHELRPDEKPDPAIPERRQPPRKESP